MTLPSSGNSISLNQIQTEFGGSNPIGVNEYYSAASGLPSSGEVNFSDFYGKAKPTTLTSGVNVTEILASDYIGDNGTLTIPANVWVWSDDNTVAALTVDVDNATIINNGYIIGRGGNGGYGVNDDGDDGGPAIKVTGTNCFIQNNSGAYIAGGGGGGASGGWYGHGPGGGGGAGGGIGGGNVLSSGTVSSTGGAGGAPGQSGSDGIGGNNTLGKGGQAGGSGAGVNENSGTDSTGTGGGGGRVLPGIGVNATIPTGNGSDWPGGYGGGAGQKGGNNGYPYYQNTSTTGGTGIRNMGAGGGGWGAAGGDAILNGTTYATGGAGGKSIQGSSSTYVNDGTLYGTNDATLNYIYADGTAYVTNGSAQSALNSNLGSFSLHQTVWDYQESGNIFTFTAGANAAGTLRFRATADPDDAPRSNSGNDRYLRLRKNGTQVASASAAANNNANLDTEQPVANGDVFTLYMDNSADWRDLGGFERILNIHIDGA